MKELNFPVLVIGAGAAGARVSIELKRNNIDPLVVSKRDHGDAHTTWARGGINASLANLDKEDSWEIHAADTLKEGHFINDPEAVKILCKNMPDIIEELDRWGMDFDKNEEGLINQRYFGAQSYRRTCYVGDYTGKELLSTLIEKAQSMNIDYKDNLYITDIITEDSEAKGAIGYDMDNGEITLINSNKVLIAAGGHTSIYDRSSSRKDENTGDGVGLAYRAGADLMDMEFVQFHPTGMVGEKYGKKWDGRLVTEAVRGEGGKLYNSQGERFMEKYSPKMMELDARDVVARSIKNEIDEGRGTENNGVYLDISHKEKQFVKEKLPTMYERFKNLGVDISEEPMEVAPTAHYIMGGIKINPKNGETSIKDLHALGESTAGVHGANRLGGNSLAETLAISKIVGQNISKNITEIETATQEKTKEKKEKISNLLDSEGNKTPEEIVKNLRSTLSSKVGILRNKHKLKEGLEEIRKIEENYNENIRIDEGITSYQFELANNLENMITASKATIKSAIKRKESRGSHYRKEYDKRKSFRKNIVSSRDKEEMILSYNTPKDVPDKIQKALDENHELDYHHLE